MQHRHRGAPLHRKYTTARVQWEPWVPHHMIIPGQGGGDGREGGWEHAVAQQLHSYGVWRKAEAAQEETHAGTQKEVSHVTNLLRDSQNPVIELDPDLFLQEEGGYKNTAGASMSNHCWSTLVLLKRRRWGSGPAHWALSTLAMGKETLKGNWRGEEGGAGDGGVSCQSYLTFLLHPSCLSARRVPDRGTWTRREERICI